MEKSKEIHKQIQHFLSEKTLKAMRELSLIIPGLQESTKDIIMLRNKFLETTVEDHYTEDILLFKEALDVYEENITQIGYCLTAIKEEIPK